MAVGSIPFYQQILKHLTQMKLVSRLFATDEMKSAAREFVSQIASPELVTKVNEQINNQTNNSKINIMRLDYKNQKPLSTEAQSQKDIEFAVKDAKLQLSSDILATEKAIAENEAILDEIKTTYPLDTQGYVNTSTELSALKEGLKQLEALKKELGL